jgi:hypothetical protein
MITNNKVHFNIVLEESQKEYLQKTSDQLGITISEFIRRLIFSYQKKSTEAQLHAIADSLVNEYKMNAELTSFTSLDGEDWR